MENDNQGLQVVEQWMNTKLFKALDIINDIGIELAIANKQNCNTGDAIVKKLRYYDVYLLIFPTKSSEHCFFSIYSPSADIIQSLPFRKMIDFHGGKISTLVSVKSSKLENWCTATSMFISLVSFWSWFYEMKTDLPEEFRSNREALKMLLLTVIIRLEDKAESEETITLTRYMYMECLKGTVAPMNPFKMLDKLSKRPKSRLNLWLLKIITKTFLTMSNEVPIQLITATPSQLVEGEDAVPQDTWMNLLNCFTGTPVHSASKVVNLMYLGYLKNKNEVPLKEIQISSLLRRQ